jgi:hypothetical protein
MYPLQPPAPSMALCSLYGPLFPLQPSVPSTACYPLYGPLFPQQPFVPLRSTVLSAALCLLYNPCLLFGPLSPLWPFVPFTALCFPLQFSNRYGTLPHYKPSIPPRPSTPSRALFSYGLLSPVRKRISSLFRKMMMLFRCFAEHFPLK